MLNNCVFLVGAGRLQEPMVKEIKSRGYQILATDRDPEAYCKDLVDELVPIDTYDINMHLAYAETLKHDPVAVLTDAADVGPTVSSLAEFYGLPACNLRAATRTRNKSTMRVALDLEHPVYTVNTGDDIYCSAAWSRWLQATRKADIHHLPAVVKACDNCASRGVTLVNSLDEFEQGYNLALKNNHLVDTVLVEEKLTGEEYATDWFVTPKGEVIFVNAAKRMFDEFGIEIGHLNPGFIDTCPERVQKLAEYAVKKLEVNGGPFKIDFLNDINYGWCILECATRWSGGYDSLLKGTLVMLANGEWVPIETINPDTEILGMSYNENLKKWAFRKAKTKHLVSHKGNEAIRIKFDNGNEITCTPNHKVLGKDMRFGYHWHWYDAKDLRIGTKLKTVGRPIQNEITEMYMRGWLAGYIEGDAHIFIRNHHDTIQCDTISDKIKDRHVLFLNEIYAVTPSVSYYDNLPGNRNPIWHFSYRVNKDRLLRRENNSEWKRGFVAGFFDAEGTNLRDSGISFSNQDMLLLSEMEKYLIEFGFNRFGPRTLCGDPKCTCESVVVNLTNSERFEFDSTFMYAKQHRANWLFFTPGSRGVIRDKDKVCNEVTEVIGIELISGDFEFYDIDSTTENFFANGELVHNSGFSARHATGRNLQKPLLDYALGLPLDRNDFKWQRTDDCVVYAPKIKGKITPELITKIKSQVGVVDVIWNGKQPSKHWSNCAEREIFIIACGREGGEAWDLARNAIRV